MQLNCNSENIWNSSLVVILKPDDWTFGIVGATDEISFGFTLVEFELKSLIFMSKMNKKWFWLKMKELEKGSILSVNESESMRAISKGNWLLPSDVAINRIWRMIEKYF